MTDDIGRMQREAARRVQQMQEHSRQVAQAHRGRTPESLAAARTPGWPGPPSELRSPGLYGRPPQAPTVPDLPEPAPPPPPPKEQPPHTPLALPQLEAEQWLLLGLALLLLKSGCSTELLLALLYLAM